MEITAIDGKPLKPGDKMPAGNHRLAPDLFGHSSVEVKALAAESDTLAYDTTATVGPDGTGKLVVTKLVVEQATDGPPVQRGELAKISVEPFIRFTAEATVLRIARDSIGFPQIGHILERLEEHGLTEADLPDLARAYRWIRLQEGKPTAILAAEVGVSVATVKRWLAKAVDAGFLMPEERTK